MIKDIIYNAKLKIEEESISLVNFLKFGDEVLYPVSKYDELIELTKILEEDYKNELRGFKKCLSNKETLSLVDKILKITGKPCHTSTRDLTVDLSKRNKWVSQNPMCVSYQDWEKWSYYICGKLNIDFKVTRKVCDFTLELTRKIIPCDILVYIQAKKKACDMNIKLDINKDRCKAELKILRQDANCDLSLKLYTELKKCNVSFDMIKKVYSCGLKLKMEAEEVVLVTDLNEYALSCIEPESLAPLLEINQTPSISIDDILNNYK